MVILKTHIHTYSKLYAINSSIKISSQKKLTLKKISQKMCIQLKWKYGSMNKWVLI